MNQFYITRNPVDIWLNVGGFKKSFTCLCYLPEQLFLLLLDGGYQKRALLHFVNFFASKFNVSGQL